MEGLARPQTEYSSPQYACTVVTYAAHSDVRFFTIFKSPKRQGGRAEETGWLEKVQLRCMY